MDDLLPSHEIFRYQKRPHAFQTFRTIAIKVAPLYFAYERHKSHKTLLISLTQYPYCPTIYN